MASPALDLCLRAAAPRVSETARAQSRLVALNEMLEVNCALLIDRLVGLRGVDAFVASSPAAMSAWYGHVHRRGRSGRRSTCRRFRSNPNF
jgi:twitching motility protein PilI